MRTFYSWFIPSKENNYSPSITRSSTVFVFALIVFTFNFLFSSLTIGQVKAAITINDLVSLHNQERTVRGLQTLAINSQLNTSAQNKAQAMLNADCWSHYCPDGKSPWEFFNEAGYVYIYAGENLAHGFTTSESVMQAWMNSPTHRANILKSEFQEIGIGIVYGTFQGQADNIVIAVHFGTRKTNGSPTPTPPTQIVPSPVTPLTKPIILEPESGLITNNNLIPIIGNADGAESVNVFNNGDEIGNIPVGGGIFTYRPPVPFLDGEQVIRVQSVAGNKSSQFSDETRFIIDTVPAAILENVVTAEGVIAGTNDRITLSLETDEKIISGKFVVNQNNYEFINIGGLKWQSDVDLEQILESENIVVELVDLAGNNSLVELNKDSILSLSTKIQELAELAEETASLDALTNLFNGLRQNSLKSQINLIFILISIIIIIIDFVALKQTGVTAFAGQQHLHLGNFLALFAVIIIGGLNGRLLDGISINFLL